MEKRIRIYKVLYLILLLATIVGCSNNNNYGIEDREFYEYAEDVINEYKQLKEEEVLLDNLLKEFNIEINDENIIMDNISKKEKIINRIYTKKTYIQNHIKNNLEITEQDLQTFFDIHKEEYTLMNIKKIDFETREEAHKFMTDNEGNLEEVINQYETELGIMPLRKGYDKSIIELKEGEIGIVEIHEGSTKYSIIKIEKKLSELSYVKDEVERDFRYYKAHEELKNKLNK